MKKRLTATITALALVLTVFAVPVSAAGGNKWIERVGNATRSVTVGQEFELKVNHGRGLDDDQIKWTIGNVNIVKFAEDDRFDDEIELRAVKAGTVKVTANNLATGGKLVYTINVKAKAQGFWIERVGSAKRYVEVYDDLDLKVRKGAGLQNNQIKWTISNTNLARFENGKNIGREVEVETKGKTGTVKVTAHNLKTGGQLVYTVVITPDYDD
jgi:hypothetical protein